MFKDWDKFSAIHYDREHKKFIVNYSESIVNKLCLLEDKKLYNIKKAYHVGNDDSLEHQIYDRIYSKFSKETFILLYKGRYPNVQIYQIDDIFNTRKLEANSNKIKGMRNNKELSELIQSIIKSLYRFNQRFSTNIYSSDILLLRNYLDEHDNRLLDIELKSV